MLVRCSKLIGVLSFFLCFDSCQKQPKLIELLPNDKTKIYFENTISVNDSINILTSQYIYNGGGVAVSDFNLDGKPDIFFTGNHVSNRLYLNKGDFEFEDITIKAHLGTSQSWSSGVTVVDINNDYWPDIYVSNTYSKTSDLRENKLYINKGLDADSIPIFEEQAKAFGLNINAHTVQSVFFDFDNDGDLDLCSIVNIDKSRHENIYNKQSSDILSQTKDLLYENREGRFVNISEESGFSEYGYGLGLFVEDFNGDGWEDIYISNDFLTRDILYINKKDGTFRNEIDDYIKHMSRSSMGVDAADINNDGAFDFMTLDMKPYDRRRTIQMFSKADYNGHNLMEDLGYAYQYPKNSLQVRDGKYFSEIAYFSSVSASDWSWSVLLADIDNDSYKDLSITNGFPKDVTDHDFSDFRSSYQSILSTQQDLIDAVPEVKIPNMIFQNTGESKFKNKTTSWTEGIATYSNGAATVDLDNDGDLDYIVNNIDTLAFIYKNNSNLKTKNHWIKIKLKGNKQNTFGLGTRMVLYSNCAMQSYTHYPTRGYLSYLGDEIHFGMGVCKTIDSLSVIWKDGKKQMLYHLSVDKTLYLSQENATSVNIIEEKKDIPFLEEEENIMSQPYHHKDNGLADFNLQRLLPKKYTNGGGVLSVGDIDGDKDEDLIISGNSRHPLYIYSQHKGRLELKDSISTEGCNSKDALFFDFDNDGDLDLYISNHPFYKAEGCNDKLMLNDGNGQFLNSELIPNMQSYKALAFDYDKDGDNDILALGGVDIDQYPLPKETAILNNKDNMLHKTSLLEHLSKEWGIVKDALFTDFNNDGWQDLILVGEWMPITFLKNDKGSFINITQDIGFDDTSGWWNVIEAFDMDSDGDMDYLVGNMGLNSRYKSSKNQPLRVYADDFDNNSMIDPIITQFDKGVEYPVYLKQDLQDQLVYLKKKYLKYADYGKATITDILTDLQIEQSFKREIQMSSSVCIKNNDGKFVIEPLPSKIQWTPTHHILPADINSDDISEVLFAGNEYDMEVFNGRIDAGNGLVLTHRDGKWEEITSRQTGFYSPKELKSMALINIDGKKYLVLTEKDGNIRFYRY